jgi:hypothetical protein
MRILLHPRSLWLTAIAPAIALLIAGCATGPAKPIALNAPGEKRISAEDVVDIGLSPDDEARIDPVFMAGSKGQPGAETGPIWASVFRSRSDHTARIEVVSAALRHSIDGLGFTARWTYTIEAVLHLGDETHTIHATGTRAAAIQTPSAMRQAVELGVLDVARQASAIVALRNRSAP